MTHDPLCPNIPERWDTEQSILWHAKCECDLISRVRKDERGNVLRDAPTSVFVKAFSDGRSSGYDTGYAAALRDAVDDCWGAVAEIPAVELWDGTKAAWWIVKADALAAIEALDKGGNNE